MRLGATGEPLGVQFEPLVQPPPKPDAPMTEYTEVPPDVSPVPMSGGDCPPMYAAPFSSGNSPLENDLVGTTKFWRRSQSDLGETPVDLAPGQVQSHGSRAAGLTGPGFYTITAHGRSLITGADSVSKNEIFRGTSHWISSQVVLEFSQSGNTQPSQYLLDISTGFSLGFFGWNPRLYPLVDSSFSEYQPGTPFGAEANQHVEVVYYGIQRTPAWSQRALWQLTHSRNVTGAAGIEIMRPPSVQRVKSLYVQAPDPPPYLEFRDSGGGRWGLLEFQAGQQQSDLVRWPGQADRIVAPVTTADYRLTTMWEIEI